MLCVITDTLQHESGRARGSEDELQA